MVGPGRILIAGGGIAGLTLAAALQRRGIEPVLVERSTAWEAVGAGIAVQLNGMRALRMLGADAAVEHKGGGTPPVVLLRPEGRDPL